MRASSPVRSEEGRVIVTQDLDFSAIHRTLRRKGSVRERGIRTADHEVRIGGVRFALE